MRGLFQALAISALCLQEQPNNRPCAADVVAALEYLASQKYDTQIPHVESSSRARSGEGEGSSGGENKPDQSGER